MLVAGGTRAPQGLLALLDEALTGSRGAHGNPA